MTSKISIDNRELLQKISIGEAAAGIDFGNAIIRELAAFRLAAMDSEPVAYADPQSFDNFKSNGGENAACTKEWMWRDHSAGLIPLYRHAQPAPVVPDAIPVSRDIDAGYLSGWNACRASMLNGGKP